MRKLCALKELEINFVTRLHLCRPALERERFELHNLKSYGPSYRKLPYQESKGLACSGRDALCWSVLNDDWVAYATWASEGSGAHRKNAFEDALACSEQEVGHLYIVRAFRINTDSNIILATLVRLSSRINTTVHSRAGAHRSTH